MPPSLRKLRATRPRGGFGAREIVAVIVIVVLLLAVLIPWILSQRTDSRRAMCLVRMEQAAKAVLDYESRNGDLPGFRNVQATDAASQSVATGWVFPLLPALGEERLVAEFGPDGPAATRGATPKVRLPELLCPDTPWTDLETTPARMSFVVNAGLPDAELPTAGAPRDWPANGLWFDLAPPEGAPDPPQKLAWIEAHDGANFTLLFSENVDCGLWTDSGESQVGFVWMAAFVDEKPEPGGMQYRINQGIGQGNGSYRFARPSAYHPGGVNIAYASGRSDFLDERIDYVAYAQVMNADGRNVKQPGVDELLPPPYRVVEEK